MVGLRRDDALGGTRKLGDVVMERCMQLCGIVGHRPSGCRKSAAVVFDAPRVVDWNSGRSSIALLVR